MKAPAIKAAITREKVFGAMFWGFGYERANLRKSLGEACFFYMFACQTNVKPKKKKP
jgi:hypothetical protein